MPKRYSRTALVLALSPRTFLLWLAAALFVAYLALIAVVMSYAALTVEFAQSVRSDEATVAILEREYLSEVSAITSANYALVGYAKPVAVLFVPGAPGTALR